MSTELEKLTAAELRAAYANGRRNFRGVVIVGEGSAGANLVGAYLVDANLADAYLAGANLVDANLVDAYLAGANLVRANLVGANLADANLVDAYLAGANLVGANLADARNVPSDLQRQDAPPPEPWRQRTHEERRQRRIARAERYRQRHPDVPVVADIDTRILTIVEANPSALNMSRWHTCETTHCRAGWAITLAGEAGKELEDAHGPCEAGRRIYMASTGRVPHFYATDAAALEDLRACAAEAANGG